MLVQLGPRKERPADLVSSLLECHERIRGFLRLAAAAAGPDASEPTEVVDACERCLRYFTEALPLHVADEEDSLQPRLRGMREDVDRALDTMHDQHAEHDPLVAELVAALGDARDAPADAPARARLADAARALSFELEEHLAIEEDVIFPAVVALLAPDVQARILGELRDRRR
jgi:iron-sulfur cluster repair protein YtfE (RIC family)